MQDEPEEKQLLNPNFSSGMVHIGGNSKIVVKKLNGSCVIGENSAHFAAAMKTASGRVSLIHRSTCS
jgi:hypothetical protein